MNNKICATCYWFSPKTPKYDNKDIKEGYCNYSEPNIAFSGMSPQVKTTKISCSKYKGRNDD